MPSGRRGQIKRVDARRRASTSVYVRRATDVDALGVNGPYNASIREERAHFGSYIFFKNLVSKHVTVFFFKFSAFGSTRLIYTWRLDWDSFLSMPSLSVKAT